jgi:hypothetical protein
MKRLMLCGALMVSLCACASNDGANPEDVNELLQALQFDDDETGCVRIDGAVDLDPGLVGSASMNVTYKKEKGDNAPDC